jgi:ABC-type tungstate transport system substrate-binding protein
MERAEEIDPGTAETTQWSDFYHSRHSDGMPLGALIALTRFPRREPVIVILNAFMGLPPVVVGLAVFLTLSRSGPLGSRGLLFTPVAMVIAQSVLVTPIITALTRQTIEDLWVEYRDELAAMNVGPLRQVLTLIKDARFSLMTALLAGFGRAAAPSVLIGPNGLARSCTNISRDLPIPHCRNAVRIVCSG